MFFFPPSDSMANILQTELLLTVVERRETKLAVQVLLVMACCGCAATGTADASVSLCPVSFQPSAFMACVGREATLTLKL